MTTPPLASAESGGASIAHVGGNAYVTIHHYRESAAPRPVRSTYWRQVERIAPPRLLDRDAELAELAGFCLGEQCGPYVWWRAGPWAGKSALLSTFVLNPPAPLPAHRVWLVSFFITARLASQDTRATFTTALTEQLCTLLGLDLPVGGDEATREAALLDLLAQAAAACQQAGGRLVLIVDGLDEDRGETTGPAAHSIAGLLPGRPPAGMRVIVASRPNPPIPDDVPDWHPLRDPGVIRLLSDSPHARDLQRLGQCELKRLLTGSPLDQDLLGLLTAARGGLSGPDLRELTGADLVTVEEVLHTVAGRTFSRRLAYWAPDDGPQVYLLGHEELHNAARHYLGHDRLAHYRDRLHAWAESYRKPTTSRPPWPAHTPEYLLRGYPRLLAATGDTNRLTALALDPARHDRMLDLSGGDTAALTEIKTCQDLLLNRPEPDLYALARLSYHRQRLESRNNDIPPELPAVWAALGQPNRAEALAHALTDPLRHSQALEGVARAVAAAGDHEWAEQLARTIPDPRLQAWALARVAGAVAAAGDHERARALVIDAEQLARTVTDPDEQEWALAEVAGAVAAAGDDERALGLVIDAEQSEPTGVDPYLRALALVRVAGAVAAAGDHERALESLTDARRLARTVTNQYMQWRILDRVAGAVAAAGDHERALRLLIKAEPASAAPHLRAWALVKMAEAVTTAGDHERARSLVIDAEQVARTIPNPDEQAGALARVAEVVAAAGDHDRARSLVIDAEQAARTTPHPRHQVGDLVRVAEAVATAGDHERALESLIDAEQFAHTVTDPYWQARAIADVTGAVTAAGDHERAEQLAHTITEPRLQAEAFAGVAEAVAAAGDHERAEQLARTINDPYMRMLALGGVAGAIAAAGDQERAEQVARTINDPSMQRRALAVVAGAIAAYGDHELAEQLARTIPAGLEHAGVAGAIAAAGDHERAEHLARTDLYPYKQARELADVAGAVAAAGDHERARALVIDAEQLARTADPLEQEDTLAYVAGAVAAAGDHERAEQLARTLTGPNSARALAGVAKVVGLPRAGHLLGEAFAVGHWLTPLPVLAKIQPQEAIRIADAMFQEMSMSD